MTDLLNTELSAYSTLLASILSTPPDALPALTTALISAESKITSASHLYESQQSNTAYSTAISTAIRSTDTITHKTLLALASASTSLSSLINKAKLIRGTAGSKVDVDDVVDYGMKIAHYTAAPRGFKSGGESGPVYPPIPQDSM
jgi:hypothetical protein